MSITANKNSQYKTNNKTDNKTDNKFLINRTPLNKNEKTNKNNNQVNQDNVEKKLNFNAVNEDINEDMNENTNGMELDDINIKRNINSINKNCTSIDDEMIPKEVDQSNQFNQSNQTPEQIFTENIYPNDDADIESLENEILIKVLDDNFGFASFRKGQLELIKNILNGNNSLAILPSGLGKSLCYQLPSLILDGVTIVVSPFLALISDQISHLPKCLSAASLTSFTTTTQRKEILQALKQKKIKILFITPERLSVENLSEIEDISLLCFDEAGSCCPSSPIFRSSYVTIKSMITTKLKPSVVLLLSNNSTGSVESYLIKEFNISNSAVVKLPINILNNIEISITRDENKLNACVSLLKSKKFGGLGATIIFCNMKRTVDKVNNYLNQNGCASSSYHSSKTELERQTIQHNFMNNKIKILVTSVGFSAGINKEDIRLVVVYDMSPNMEQLIQQIGRGGRDQKKTHVHVFLNEDDYFNQRNMIFIDNVARVII